MRLEAVADRDCHRRVRFPLRDGRACRNWIGGRCFADCLPTVAAASIRVRWRCGSIAAWPRELSDVCRRRPELPVVLAGGVFQNRLLTELVAEMMERQVAALGLPGIIPPNDGGLAAGQLAIAAAKGGLLPCA